MEFKSSSSIEQVELLFESKENSDCIDEQEVDKERFLLDDEKLGILADGSECDENEMSDGENNDEDGTSAETYAPALLKIGHYNIVLLTECILYSP